MLIPTHATASGRAIARSRREFPPKHAVCGDQVRCWHAKAPGRAPVADSHTHDPPSDEPAASSSGQALAWRPRSGKTLPRGCGAGKTLFLDASTSGVAGDMLAAALLDLGVPAEVLEAAVASLGVAGYRLTVERSSKSGIVAPRFVVEQTGEQPFRDYAAIKRLLFAARPLPDGARNIALKAFRILAEAEAATHGMEVEEVHFHEVGALDSIIDTVCAAAGLDYIGASHVVASPMPLGRGIIRGAAHGPLPNPPPATLSIFASARVPTFYAGLDRELVTPTGACLVAAVAKDFADWPAMAPVASSYGAGTASFPDRPNLFRLVLGEPLAAGGAKAMSGGHSHDHSSLGHHHHDHHHDHPEAHGHGESHHHHH